MLSIIEVWFSILSRFTSSTGSPCSRPAISDENVVIVEDRSSYSHGEGINFSCDDDGNILVGSETAICENGVFEVPIEPTCGMFTYITENCMNYVCNCNRRAKFFTEVCFLSNVCKYNKVVDNLPVTQEQVVSDRTYVQSLSGTNVISNLP